MLNLAEDILLLALDDDSGKATPLPPRALSFTLATGLLMELALQKRIQVTTEQVTINDTSVVEGPLLNEVFDQIKALDTEPLTLVACLSEIAGTGQALRDRVALCLIEKKILTREDEHILKIITRPTYPMIDGTQEEAMRNRIRAIVLEGKKTEERDRVLISLMDVCGLTSSVFSEEEMGQAAEKIEKIRAKEAIGDALAEVISNIQEALSQVLAF